VGATWQPAHIGRCTRLRRWPGGSSAPICQCGLPPGRISHLLRLTPVTIGVAGDIYDRGLGDVA